MFSILFLIYERNQRKFEANKIFGLFYKNKIIKKRKVKEQNEYKRAYINWECNKKSGGKRNWFRRIMGMEEGWQGSLFFPNYSYRVVPLFGSAHLPDPLNSHLTHSFILLINMRNHPYEMMMRHIPSPQFFLIY
jgi:hypothetical protein